MRTIAIVDRSADVEAAARALVTARFRFQGTSPYGPDLVIVNDFVQSDLTEACAQHARRFYTSSATLKQPSTTRDHQTKKAFKDAEANNQISVFGSNNFMIAKIQDK